ncbi:MAG: DEAD/DEAH box helicase [Proteobacteria bacterium]|nr:DEAD/DEAH box helicase [Pseudomonadota bacterium]
MSSAQPQPRPGGGSGDRGFDRFRLHPSLIRRLREADFREPRPIQAETIPAGLEGRDVLGLAQTGTGKTAAFALPILQRLIEEPGPGPLVLVLAPTRELAVQIDAEFRMLAERTKIRTATVFGGTPARPQVQALRRRPQIVVGCPGRVLDLLQQRQLDLSEIETLVLDEADHMFDMGFLPDIQKIVAALPRDRQNLLFSATMPKAIRQLADRMLFEPHVVELAPSAPAERIDHALYPIAERSKRALLDRILAEEDCGTAIVFTRTKHRAKRLGLQLAKQGVRAVSLQGNMSQPQRDRAMRGFRGGRFDVLVATDIAARGLDVAGIDYVINFDPPNTPETYTHRIGRTGRSEANGKACTFVTREDAAWVRETERMLGAPIPQRTLPGFEPENLRSGSRRDRPKSGTSRSRRPRSGSEGSDGSGARRRRPRRGGSSGTASRGRSGTRSRPRRGR